MVLTTEQKASFWRDGFLPYPQLLHQDELRMLQQRTEDIAYGRVKLPETYRGAPLIQKEPRGLYRF
ncbi:MAG: hypothetical protein HY326_04785 [Chloroflexi bacterium]|nr:hypothetical protein [Chloroflexota bacterium]